MFIKLLTRVFLVTVAFVYATPYVAGVKFHGDLLSALIASLVFNAAVWALECLLGVIVFGVNIGTLGLGSFLTGSIKFIAALVVPSLALISVGMVLPRSLHVVNYFPGAVVYGLVLGGLLWASLPQKSKA